MHLVIAKVNESYFDGEAVSVTLPGAEGSLTVLDDHMPLVTTLKPGTITIREEGKEPIAFLIENGVLEVHKDGVTVIL